MARINWSLASALALSATIPGAGPAQERFTDPRDGYAYAVTTIGGRRWFAENLRVRTADSRCYEGDEANCAEHGRLYRYADAERACPAGWHLPSEEEWRRLELTIGMRPEDVEKENGRGDPVARRLKVGGDTGFNVRYSGWIDPHLADSSRAMGRSAAWWTTTPGRRTTYRPPSGTGTWRRSGTPSGGRR